MNWTEKDKPREPITREVEDRLKLTDVATVSIQYEPYKSVSFWLVLPFSTHKVIDVADHDGTRRMALRELLPLAEAALVALRQAVEEIDRA